LQTSVLQGLHVAGVHPDAMLLLGRGRLHRPGPETGAVVAFVRVSSPTFSCRSPRPVGADVQPGGFAVGAVQTSDDPPDVVDPPITAFVASAAASSSTR